jgi:MerR family transcriptional regulator/heat shock protein HspR
MSTQSRPSFDLPEDAPVYVISVAAELTGLHPQTLRQYDRLGLVSPGRSTGRGRRYSAREIEQLREVVRLSADGIGLNGIKRILELEAHIDALQRQVSELQSRVPDGRAADRPAPSRLGPRRDVVPVREQTALVVWSRNQH